MPMAVQNYEYLRLGLENVRNGTEIGFGNVSKGELDSVKQRMEYEFPIGFLFR